MGRLISLIYFYLISVIALILLIIGVYNGISYTINVTQYEEYPLRYAGNENCEFYPVSAPAKPVLESQALPSPETDKENVERQTRECKARVERERKQTKIDDVKNTISFTLLGFVLLAVHLPIALRKSSEEKKDKK